MDKSLIVALIDAVFVFIGFVLAKYVSPEWSDAVKALLLAVQPIVVVLVLKWLQIEFLARAAAMGLK